MTRISPPRLSHGLLVMLLAAVGAAACSQPAGETALDLEGADSEAADNRLAGEEFLSENAQREDVIVTDSGLQYEVLVAGEGPHPSATDTVTVHYRGTTLDGKEFDGSRSHDPPAPATFGLNRVIAGWTEGLQLMSVGSQYKLYIPADLAYGDSGRPGFGPGSTLVFEVELLEIVVQE